MFSYFFAEISLSGEISLLQKTFSTLQTWMDTHCKITAMYSVESALIFGTIDSMDGLVGGGREQRISFSKNNQVTIGAKGREGVVKNSCLCMRDE